MDTIIVALISLVGTLVGSIYGIKKSASLTIYRINQLENKVDRLSEISERLIAVEKSSSSAHKRIDELIERIE